MCHDSCSNLAKLVILGWRNHTYPGIPRWSVVSTADAARYNSFQGLVSLFYRNFLSLMLQHNKLEHCHTNCISLVYSLLGTMAHNITAFSMMTFSAMPHSIMN